VFRDRNSPDNGFQVMRFAYADPPYLGCGALYAKHHPDALAWDSPDEHARLIQRLCDEYPDGWVMSLSVPSLRVLLPMCPPDARVGAWVKPFAIFKPNVNPAYAWEPVIWRGGRKRGRDMETVRDWCDCCITLRRGLTGAKPRRFCRWVFSLLNAKKGDALDDLFPGSGAVDAAWREWTGEDAPKLWGALASRPELIDSRPAVIDAPANPLTAAGSADKVI
jgi:hypothetical protein